MGGNGLEESGDLLDQPRAWRVTQQWCEGQQHLERPFETDLAWWDVMQLRGLSHHFVNEIVRQEVCPQLLLHRFGRLASEYVHLQYALERTQIEFGVPALPKQLRDGILGK